ncbi:LysR family transcriptional regulator [Janthinobacterium sp. SUN118]|uniref:LysR family transcriptional regulator n=1 Tax=Janthinobacterium sp. SUN118 TaxID=3004100 RepID=UPI0025B10271|nr:LysR family transcriptional regulator [Janthinobacterium sp. SUN118]MDN2712872.1 LysR family transcriptional regulator [Janthinobacterium sp. SUN118]
MMSMSLADLRVFCSAARQPTLGAAALELHVTPSAVSKALRRLEGAVGAPLFDRAGKQLLLNDSGRLLLARARPLLALAEQARHDVTGARGAIDARIAGPALLLWRHAAALASALDAYPQASLRLQPAFEDAALAALARGDCHAALVTQEAIAQRGGDWPASWQCKALGSMRMRLAAGRSHALAHGVPAAAACVPCSLDEVLRHAFASPTHSLLCGEERGRHADGWRGTAGRTIRYWSDDVQLLLAYVQSGRALAYLPDFAVRAHDLLGVEVADAVDCSEQVLLVWDGALAGQWLHAVAEQLLIAPI